VFNLAYVLLRPARRKVVHPGGSQRGSPTAASAVRA